MENSKTFLLNAIIGHDKNDYASFGELNARHCDDIARLMNEFVKEVIINLIPILNEGKSVNIDGLCVQINLPKKRKR